MSDLRAGKDIVYERLYLPDLPAGRQVLRQYVLDNKEGKFLEDRRPGMSENTMSFPDYHTV
jgi:hypothetical protein